MLRFLRVSVLPLFAVVGAVRFVALPVVRFVYPLRVCRLR